MLAAYKQILFLTISNDNILFETQDTRLGTIVTTNKSVEWALQGNVKLPKYA